VFVKVTVPPVVPVNDAVNEVPVDVSPIVVVS